MIQPIANRPPSHAHLLAERFGTPLYVFDGARLAGEAAAFQTAWGPQTTVGYSMKCNPLMGVVARLHLTGCWAEVASGFEYRAARRAGVPGHEIIFNGPLKRIAEIQAAFADGATVILDGAEQVRDAARIAAAATPRTRVGLRLTPPDRIGRDRFGATPAEAARHARTLAGAGLALSGLHVHLGAYQLGPLPPSGPPIHGVTVEYPVPVSRFAAAAAHAETVAADLGGIDWLDLGGGWPAAAGLADHIAAVRERLTPGRRLILEPGRALVRDAGWLLTQVVAVRGPGEVVVDAGITHVPCVLWKRSPVHPAVPRAGAERATNVFGPLCLQHDALARETPLPPLLENDLVWIGQAGAYAIAQASPFIHLRPGAVMVEGDRATLLRARETDDEALSVQAEPLLAGRMMRAVGA